MDSIVRAIGLGLAGIDPLGALMLMAAITAAVTRSKLFLFAGTVLVGTVATGVALTLAGDELLEVLSNVGPGETSKWWASLEIAVGVFVAYWVYTAVRDEEVEDKTPKKSRTLRGGLVAFTLAGLAFSLTAVIDPTFLALAAVAGPSSNLAAVVVSFVLWTLISQFMLFALVVAYGFGAHRRIIDWASALWTRHRSRALTALHILGIIAAALLVIDGVTFLATGSYLG